MKVIVFLALVLQSICQKGYKLTIYQPGNCYYCKFAENQIKQLIQEYHWDYLLNFQVVECQAHIQQCRDDQLRPLLIIQDRLGNKINQVGGVRSKLYFRDWISDVLSKNPIQTQISNTQNGKYREILVKNVQEVSNFFKMELARKRKIKSDKFNILKQINSYYFNEGDEIDEQSGGRSNQEQSEFQQTNDQPESRFRQIFRTIAMTSVYIFIIAVSTLCIITVKDYFRNRKKNKKSVRIPTYQID